MSKNYDVTIKWHTPADATVREAVVKTWASSPKLAEKIGLRGARLDGTLPTDAIIDPAFPGTMMDKINVAPAPEADGRPSLMLAERVETPENVPETAADEDAAENPANTSDGEKNMADRFHPGTRVDVEIVGKEEDERDAEAASQALAEIEAEEHEDVTPITPMDVAPVTPITTSNGEQDMVDRFPSGTRVVVLLGKRKRRTGRFPSGTRVVVLLGKRKRRTGAVDYRVDATSCHVTLDGPNPSVLCRYNQLSLDDGSEPLRSAEKPPRKPRAAPSGDRKPSRRAELDAAAAQGEMPAKPIMTSKANPHYQARFDKLEALAHAGDWDGVRAYQVKGINSYAKMVAAYRDRLLAAHQAQLP